MIADVEIIKGIPKEEINRFEDRVVYNTASLTREYVKGASAYPHLSGELEREELKEPIEHLGNCEYGLLEGVKYAKYVWKMSNVKWTNETTMPQWYYSAFNRKGASLLHNAVNIAIKEIGKK